MSVIIVTVVTQGVLVPSEDRGTFDGSLLIINDGIFQAVGVISFGTPPPLSSLPLPPFHPSLPAPPSPATYSHPQPSSATTTPS